jgi:hypothetical protein
MRPVDREYLSPGTLRLGGATIPPPFLTVVELDVDRGKERWVVVVELDAERVWALLSHEILTAITSIKSNFKGFIDCSPPSDRLS